ncbi:DEAD/DEAH box helicase [Phanerochaete sordida]|uniref:DEAD/DEAH box helicase n=1 Tax=Phanerochaete sordida TaxID=48140 RepID=A0A9P3GJR9_9APHY|nr:DEAD/DEAH box helicase [Phanerochaete sordida]
MAECEKNALLRSAAGDKTGFNGTLLAWETGMGKTVVTIRLILSTADNGPTLILCPNVEIARQWRSEITKFAPQLTVRFYHSEDSSSEDYKIESDDLACYDVVLSTYNQLLSQYAYMEKARKDGLAFTDKEYPFYVIRWYRVVSEEAHKMSNPCGKTAAACWALPKRLGLLLTATPLQNYPCDLYALLRFLGRDYAMLAKTKKFPEMYDRRYRAKGVAPAAGFQDVKEILGDCMIHRRKAAVSIHLPKRHDHKPRLVALAPPERRLYDYTDREHHHKGPLPKCTRVRQVCVGPKMLLVPLSKDDEELANDTSAADVVKAMEEISQVGTTAGPHTQSAPRTDKLVISKLPESIRHLAHLFDATYVPSAQREVLAVLQEIKIRSRGTEKTIVYSTFRSPLETLSAQLDILNIGNEIYYGNMSSDERTTALQRLDADARCTVLLMTIQSGGTGLNITSCNNVVFLEPWWNPYLEEQAVGRVYRIGQTKPVNVYRVLVADTIQTEKMVPIQNKKRENIDKLLGQLEVS